VIVTIAIPMGLRPRVLPDALVARLAAEADVHVIEDGAGYAGSGDSEILVTGWGSPPIDDRALGALPRLRAVMHVGGSVRELIRADVWSRGVLVVTAADVNNEFVADFVVSMMLLSLKGSFRARRAMLERGQVPGAVGGEGIVGQTVGLVSFGSIARKTADHLRRWDVDVLAWDPHLDEGAFAALGVRRAASPAQVFAESLVVSLHSPLIPGVTEGMIGDDLLRLMRQGATFINTARGALVDEGALVEVLRERPDLFAVLDVTWPEPPLPGSELFELPNVLLTGHTAGSVGSETARMGELVVEQALALVRGEEVRHTVGRGESANRA
jgi:phosphoglycerate dehydrogenase-like enzyme